MTAIIGFVRNGMPMLMGDTLLTCESMRRVPPLATIGVLPKLSGNHVAGQMQKVAIVNSGVAVAWAGSAIAARTYINELRSALQQIPPSEDAISECDIKTLGPARESPEVVLDIPVHSPEQAR